LAKLNLVLSLLNPCTFGQCVARPVCEKLFVAFAITGAIPLMPGAAKSSSAVLYILIFGGLFVGVPATLDLAVILAQLKLRTNQHGRKKTSN